ncbi:MAG: 50S ribosomal protein L20 [Candidatus Omnitrophota bacterium]
MVRVATSRITKKRHRKVLRQVKGAFLGRSKIYKHALHTLRKAMVYATRDRKTKKREFRRLWITRISAACRQEGISYSKFMNGLRRSKVALDRKILADLAALDAAAFKKLVGIATSAK